MPTVADTVRRLEALVPPSKAAGWDRIGLQVGDREAPVESLAVCHEVTNDVVAHLERGPVDLVIAYHPLLFRPVASFVAGRGAAGRAFRLAASGTALAVVHTAFDVAPGGAADALAAAVGLRDATGFGPNWGSGAAKIVTFVPHDLVETVTGAMAAAGGGHIGGYSGCSFRSSGIGAFVASDTADPYVGRAGEPTREPEVRVEMIAPAPAVDRVIAALVAAHPYDEPAYDVYEVRANAGFIGRRGPVSTATLGEFAAAVGAILGCTPRVAGDLGTAVTSAAVVPGSGGSLVPAAAAIADVLVTGDVSHHQARDAIDRRLAVVDVGHVASERPGIDKLYAAVAQLGVPVHTRVEIDPDPWSRRDG
jgi:dinuclear metal center YbgI/SA1388 family protein